MAYLQERPEAFDLIQRKEAKLPPQSQADITALKIVVQDVARGERWLQMKSHPIDWNRYERLYLFQVPQAFWDGTNIARAALGMPLVMEHVESLLAQSHSSLFSQEPYFASEPRPATKMDAARANDALLAWELDKTNFREEMRLTLKSSLIYGTGIAKWGWKKVTRERVTYRRAEPAHSMTIAGQVIQGQAPDEIEEVRETEEVNLPTFENVNIRHVIVDPGCRTQDIRTAKWVCHRIYMTAQQLDDLRQDPRYQNIPSQSDIIDLFFPPREVAKASTLESYGLDLGLHREFKAQPRAQITSVDPLQEPLEVLEYWTKDRVYTVLQRKLVIRNEINEFGEIPFCSAAFVDILDSFYGIGIAKLIGTEQRIQQGIINSHLDDLALSLNGMFIRKRGTNTPTQQLRVRPGGIIDTDDEKGVQLLERQPYTDGALEEIAASDSRAQRRTGAQDIAVQGMMPSQKSSVTRTATGVQMLNSGIGTRIQYFVENVANNIFIPTLYAFHKMNARYLAPQQIQSILSDELNEAYKGDPLELVNAQMDFQILAGARMQAKAAMGQALPLMFQFLLTQPVIEALQQQGKKVNVAEMVNMLFDVTGWRNKQDVIQQMSMQDQQRAMMNNPMVQQQLMAQQQAQQEQGNKLQVIDEENAAKAGQQVVRSLLKHAELQAHPPTENGGL